MRDRWVEDLQLGQFGRLLAGGLLWGLHHGRSSSNSKDPDEVRWAVKSSNTCPCCGTLVVTSKGELCLPQYPNRSARPRDRGEGTGLYVKYLGMLLAFDSQEDTRLR